MKDISVVIPTFNRLGPLPQAIGSCLSAGAPAVACFGSWVLSHRIPAELKKDMHASEYAPS
jgi:hypothetical protein